MGLFIAIATPWLFILEYTLTKYTNKADPVSYHPDPDMNPGQAIWLIPSSDQNQGFL